ncbi:MAG: CHAT domain-containing protein [Acidobacteriota bacterium]|nr:CHAT domain-containing protein [Acidobacteriota bacterium]
MLLGFLVLSACAETSSVPPDPEPATPPPHSWPANELHPGGTVTAPLEVEERRRYHLPLAAGELLRLRVEQHGIDVKVALEAPDGKPLLRVDRLIADLGQELLLVVTAEAGLHTLDIAAFPASGPGRIEMVLEELRPATEEDRLATGVYRRFVEADTRDPEAARQLWEEALATWRRRDDGRLEGEVLARMARDHFDHRRWWEAAQRYEQAAEALERGGDRSWAAYARVDQSSMLLQSGETEKALAVLDTTLATVNETEDRITAAMGHHNLGLAFDRQGEPQQALDHYRKAAEMWPSWEAQRRPSTLHNLGVLYARHFHDPQRGRELLESALAAWPDARKRQRARTLNQLGHLAYEEKRLDRARQHYVTALEEHRADESCGRALVLARLTLVEEAEGDPAAADRRLEEALKGVENGDCPVAEVTVRRLAANIAEQRGDLDAALAGYEKCRDLYDALDDGLGLAQSFTSMARVHRQRGEPATALAINQEALELLEGVRPQVLREDLRTSFFATVQDPFLLHIDLLMELNRWEEAWGAADRARARALRDLLQEADAGLRQAADPALVERELNLQRRLNVLESRRAGARESAPERLLPLQREMSELVEKLETLRGEIRRRDPRYAELTSPRSTKPEALRRDLLDDDTVLLQYHLGPESSFLWVVTRQDVRAFPLGAPSRIAQLAAKARRWSQSIEWPGKYPPAFCELSRRLLAPATPWLAGRKLVLVPDGPLEALPFAALPDPANLDACSDAEPLIAAHEITYLPSASTLALQRRRVAQRPAAEGWLAMVADPVYGFEDERWRSPPPTHEGEATRSPTPSGRHFRRLPHAGAEARAALAGLPPEKTFQALGFDASTRTVTSGALEDFRIVHFATHGVLDTQQPLLSFLALARLDRRGREVDGVLSAHRIYDLDLPAELVVLSACDTARGRRVAGEGLVAGLPRAFLYAGAERVLVSLWAVPDESTGELMQRFYRGLLQEELAPPRALQQAQRELWRAGHPPYRWGAFVLQGDWRPLSPFDPR